MEVGWKAVGYHEENKTQGGKKPFGLKFRWKVKRKIWTKRG